jgi:hypothetical protein
MANRSEFIDWQNLSQDQCRFLRACRDDPWTLDELVARFNLQSWRMSKWLRRPTFRKRLAEILRDARHRRELDLELAAKRAGRTLREIATGLKGAPASDVSRQACVDLIKLADGVRRRRKRPKPADPFADHNPVHPDVPRERAIELAKEMEAARARAESEEQISNANGQETRMTKPEIRINDE